MDYLIYSYNRKILIFRGKLDLYYLQNSKMDYGRLEISKFLLNIQLGLFLLVSLMICAICSGSY